LFKSPFSRDLCINRNDWQNPIFAQLVISLKLALAGLRLGLKNRQVGEKWVYQAQLVEDEIKTLVDNDKQLKHQVKLLLSIDGIGNKTAWAIIAYMGAISLFDNAKQVASFAGLNPKNMDCIVLLPMLAYKATS
jgi:transposase